MLLTITMLAGLALLTAFLGQSSEADNRFFLGLSLPRLIVGMVFLFLVLVNAAAALLVGWQILPHQDVFEGRMSNLGSENSNVVMAALYFVTLITAITLLSACSPMAESLRVLEPIRLRMAGFITWLVMFSAVLSFLFRFSYAASNKNAVLDMLDRIFLIITIFLAVFFSYQHLFQWAGGGYQTRFTYFNLLAQQFIQGQLYLENPPQTYDLVFFDGKWYVPMPPVPAILMMPLAYLIGGNKINSHDFSIAVSALNSVLLFLILEQMRLFGWIKLSRKHLLWLVALFAFSTPHLWVGLSGQSWFLSQIIAVSLIAFATFAALKSWSPWMVGAAIGLAVGTRPNSIISWLFVFAITAQLVEERNQGIKQMIIWAFKSGLPIILAIAGLLAYNDARFGTFTDFGYTTLNGDPEIIANAQAHGLFSPHFIPSNLRVMLFELPLIRPNARWPIQPSGNGMSIFLVTPVLFYLFRRYERRWWILGAWATVFCGLALLLLYHNTGSRQFGYRYILDIIVPLISLLAVAFRDRMPWHFFVLLFIGIIINLYGAYWFFNT